MSVPDAVRVFPTRPMAVRPPGGGQWLRGLLGFLLIAAFLGGPLAWFGPGIVQDQRMRADARPLPSGRVSDGRCRIYLGFLTLCDATLTARGKNGPVTDDLHYAFAAWPGTQHVASVMQSAAWPERLTTDIGLDNLTNRMATLGGWVLLWLGLLVAGGVAMWREARRRGRIIAAARSGVRPMLARLVSVGARQGRSWTLGWHDGGPRTATWRVGRKDQPFLISADGWMLALAGPPGTPPMPMDDRLAWADLTEEERRRVVAARDAQWAGHPPAG